MNGNIGKRRSKDAYRDAASAVLVSKFPPAGDDPGPSGHKRWVALVDLLRDSEVAGVLNAPRGDISPEIVDALRQKHAQLHDFWDVWTEFTQQLSGRIADIRPEFDGQAEWAKRILAARDRDSIRKNTDRIPEIFDELKKRSLAPNGRDEVHNFALDLPQSIRYTVERKAQSVLETYIDQPGIVGISGGPGTGKSQLAIHVIRQKFANAINYYFDLDSGSAESRLTKIADAFGVGQKQILEDPSGARAAIAAALERFPGCVLFDNATDLGELAAILPATTQARILITTTDLAIVKALAGTELVHLGVFDDEESFACFSGRIGADAVEAQKPDVQQICELLGNLPIAIDVAAATIAANGYRVSDWLSANPDTQTALKSLSTGGRPAADVSISEARSRQIVEFVLQAATVGLSTESIDLIIHLSQFHAGSGGNQSIVEHSAGLAGSGRLAVGWKDLRNRSLVSVSGQSAIGGSRYHMHGLMQTAVQNLIDSRGTRERVDEQYIRTMASVVAELAGLVATNSTIAQQAFNEESESLRAIVNRLIDAVDLPSGIQEELDTFVTAYAENCFYLALIAWPLEQVQSMLDKATESVGGSDLKLQANIHRACGILHLRNDKYEDAVVNFERSVEISKQVDYESGEAYGLKGLGDVCYRRGEAEKARHFYEHALTLFMGLDDLHGQANTLRSVGEVDVFLGDLPAARTAYERALPIYSRVNARLGEANTMLSLADLALRSDDLASSRQYAETALDAFRSINALVSQANALSVLGDIEDRSFHLDTAIAFHEQALDWRRQSGDGLGTANSLRSLGDLNLRRSDFVTARSQLEEAYAIFRRIGNRLGEAGSLLRLGELERMKNQYAAAKQRCEEARSIFLAINNTLGVANATRALADLDRLLGDWSSATGAYQHAISLFKQIGDRIGEAYAHKCLGDIDLHQNDFESAENRYRQAFSMSILTQDRHCECDSLLGLASLEWHKGNLDVSDKYCSDALSILRETKNALDLRKTYGEFGQRLSSAGRYEEAIVAFWASLGALPQTSDPTGFSISLNGMQAAMVAINDTKGILACLNLVINTGGGGREDEFAALLGDIYRLQTSSSVRADFEQFTIMLQDDPLGALRNVVFSTGKQAETDLHVIAELLSEFDSGDDRDNQE